MRKVYDFFLANVTFKVAIFFLSLSFSTNIRAYLPFYVMSKNVCLLRQHKQSIGLELKVTKTE